MIPENQEQKLEIFVSMTWNSGLIIVEGQIEHFR
jgi:hypothetical protein